jgi:hypothetical protein
VGSFGDEKNGGFRESFGAKKWRISLKFWRQKMAECGQLILGKFKRQKMADFA